MRGIALRIVFFFLTLIAFGVRSRSVIAAYDARTACLEACDEECQPGCYSSGGDCRHFCEEDCPQISAPSSSTPSTPSPPPLPREPSPRGDDTFGDDDDDDDAASAGGCRSSLDCPTDKWCRNGACE